MERIIDTLETTNKINNQEYAKKYREAGFGLADYPEITEQAIENFLRRKITSDYSGKRIEFSFLWREKYGLRQSFGTKGKIFSEWEYLNLSWVETSPKDFVGTPPIHILDSIIKAGVDFDEMKIVTLSYKVAQPDPLLIGIKNRRRYLVDWWDKDVDPCELLK